ncbi:MAG: hypothetical protein OFPII_38970 [Osedax symbiont Rs1]|nr:MAG: hypothetical protein OFPII_38970 [Osedax symbiont Rs1]
MLKNLSCEQHDYFEIICMRQSLMTVTTHKNRKYCGIAVDIKRVNNSESLQINRDNKVEYVALAEIKRLEVSGNKIIQHNFAIEL